MRHLTEEGLRFARRLGRHKFKQRRQVVRQFAFRQDQAGLFVGLAEVDHRRAAVARIAVHMLEDVQRRGAAAVEQRHVVGLAVQRVCALQRVHECFDLGQARRADGAFLAQQLLHLGQVAAQRRVGVTEQRCQHAQGLHHRHRGVRGKHDQTSALMGMVRFLSLPKRLTSVLPSEQPLPKLKPQPPRTLKVFSAYSRCVVGITKRSS